MNKPPIEFINAGVELFSSEAREQIAVNEAVAQAVKGIIDDFNNSRQPELRTPEGLQARDYALQLGDTACRSQYTRDFALVSAEEATASEASASLASSRLVKFTDTCPSGIIIVQESSGELPPAQQARRHKMSELLYNLHVPVAILQTETPAIYTEAASLPQAEHLEPVVASVA